MTAAPPAGPDGGGEPAATRCCRLTAPARPESVNVIQDLLDELWNDDPSVSPVDRMRFGGAVVEVASNIVEHALVAPEKSVVTIELTVTCEPAHLHARFDDDGEPTPEAVQPAGEREMPDWEAESGRGLAMIALMTDDLSYERIGSANRWSITCLRSQ